ncbi:hypothetical protein Lser_V15G42806 [Lactuca serriola]
MMSSQLLLSPSWRPHSSFHSDLDHYDPKIEVYAGEHHDFSSLIASESENSSKISSANFPTLSSDYDLMHNPSSVNMKGFGDVYGWLCVDDQQMGEIPTKRSIGGDHVLSPNQSDQSSATSSVCVASENQSPMEQTDDSMESESQEGIHNLLMAYADAMGKGQGELATVIVKCISEKTNTIGSPLERLALNLFQPEENQGEAYLKQESVRNFNPAFRAFYDIFPYGRFAHFTSSSVILQAVPTYVDSVHIIDFDIGEGTQWPPVIEAMARAKRSLTITSIKLEEHVSGFEETKRQLLNYARTFCLNLMVEEMELSQMVKGIGGRNSGNKFLAFNCMVGLPHMGRTRRTTQVLEFIKIAKGILVKNKGIITFGDGEESERMGNSPDYASFFNKHLAHYKALYESMEWGFPSYLNEARIAMETLFLAPYVSSFSWFQKWKEQRENMVFQEGFGLKGERMSMESRNEAREMVREGETPYKIRVEGDDHNEMVLEWREIPLVRVSAWRQIK